jgi:transcription-repair coupling factor (superfamily II helicase)
MSFDFSKSLAKPGHRLALPNLHGSSDAYALAQAATALKSENVC